MPILNPVEVWETKRKLDLQVFILTTEGDLNRWEVMEMTNFQRKTWLDLMTEKAKREKEEADKIKNKTASRMPTRSK